MRELQSKQDWDAVVQQSKDESVLVLKHSNICPISTEGYDRVQQGKVDGVIAGPVVVIVIQDQRELSSQVATDLTVKHESPQVIVLKNGKSVYDCSHLKIDAETIASAMQ